MEEPSVEETVDILHGLRTRYEDHHEIQYTDEALRSSAQLSHRYVSDRYLPDKAIDLIDEAGAKMHVAMHSRPVELKKLKRDLDDLRKREEDAWTNRDYEAGAQLKTDAIHLESEYKIRHTAWQEQVGFDGVVNDEHVAQVVHAWTGIPVSQMLESETDKLLRMEDYLHERIIGQDEAIVAVSDAIRRSRAGLRTLAAPLARSSSWARLVSAKPSWHGAGRILVR